MAKKETAQKPKKTPSKTVKSKKGTSDKVTVEKPKRGRGGVNPNDPHNTRAHANLLKAKEATRKKMQEDFLITFEASMCLVATACKKANISRNSFYDWMKKYPEFKQRVEDIQEGQKDFVEASMLKKIKDGDTTMQIFYAKTKMKDRGYTEKHELDVHKVDDLDYSKLSDEELVQYNALLDKMRDTE